MRKILEAVLAAKISDIVTTHNLLLKMHFEGWRRSFVETAIQHPLVKIFAVWNENKIASLLMIDVSTAYLNTSHQRLLHNLRKNRIDIKVVGWVASFLTNCQTIVKTNEHTTPKLFLDLGLPQCSPLSSILYLFHNGDVLNDFAKGSRVALGFIEFITFIAKGKPIKGNNQTMAKVHNQICESWRMKHGSEFSLLKYQLIHISRKRNINYTSDVRLSGGHLV